MTDWQVCHKVMRHSICLSMKLTGTSRPDFEFAKLATAWHYKVLENVRPSTLKRTHKETMHQGKGTALAPRVQVQGGWDPLLAFTERPEWPGLGTWLQAKAQCLHSVPGLRQVTASLQVCRVRISVACLRRPRANVPWASLEYAPLPNFWSTAQISVF